MKRFMAVIGITTSLVASVAMAGEVDGANVNTFSSGAQANAGEVNQNFDALIAAINDNAQQIQQLQADLSSLDVAGKTYKIYNHRVEIEENGGGAEATALRGEEFTVTLNADGTLDITGGEETNAYVDSSTGSLSVTTSTFSGSSGLSWQRSGNLVTIDDSSNPDGGATFLVAPGARTLIYLEKDTDTQSNYHQEVLMGVQVISP